MARLICSAPIHLSPGAFTIALQLGRLKLPCFFKMGVSNVIGLDFFKADRHIRVRSHQHRPGHENLVSTLDCRLDPLHGVTQVCSNVLL